MSETAHSPPAAVDATLVQRAKLGCRDSIEELVRQYQLPLRAFLISRVGDREAADDIAQEVFVAALKGLASLKNNQRFQPWLFQVARNKSVDHLRSKQRSRETPLEHLDDLAASVPVDLPADDQLLAALTQCIEQLGKRARWMIDRFYFEKMTSQEIASASNQKSSSVRMGLMRIRKTLGKCIQARSRGVANES